MRRADRLFEIIQHLRGAKLLTASQLAQRLEVSVRTVYRDIADLQAAGVPIDGEAGVGYVLRPGYDLPPLMFSHDEVVALVAGARMVQAHGGLAMARAAAAALAKIATVLPDRERLSLETVGIRAPARRMSEAEKHNIDRCEAACTGQKVLRFAYTDAEGRASTRTVNPLNLWFWSGQWMLVGWCHLREDFRMFRTDRMTGLDMPGSRFEAQPGRTIGDFFEKMVAKGEVPADFDFEAHGM